MGTLWYGSIIELGDIQYLVSQLDLHQYHDAFEFLKTIRPDELPLGHRPDNREYDTNNPAFMNMQDVAQFLNILNLGATFATCGMCCREHYPSNRFIVGCKTDRIDSRGDSCIRVRIPTEDQRSCVQCFCDFYGLPGPDFYLNGEECYVCGH